MYENAFFCAYKEDIFSVRKLQNDMHKKIYHKLMKFNLVVINMDR